MQISPLRRQKLSFFDKKCSSPLFLNPWEQKIRWEQKISFVTHYKLSHLLGQLRLAISQNKNDLQIIFLSIIQDEKKTTVTCYNQMVF